MIFWALLDHPDQCGMFGAKCLNVFLMKTNGGTICNVQKPWLFKNVLWKARTIQIQLFIFKNEYDPTFGHSNEYRYVKAFGEDRWYGENLSKSHLNLR